MVRKVNTATTANKEVVKESAKEEVIVKVNDKVIPVKDEYIEKSAEEILVGIDVGFGETKFISNAKPNLNVIPSTVVEGHKSSSKLFDLDTINMDSLVVTTEDGTYFVGEQAMYMPNSGSARTQVRNRAKDRMSRVLFHTGIGLSVPDETGVYDVHIVTGVPNDDYGLRVKEDLEEFLLKPFKVEFHLSSTRSITKEIRVVSLEILRQPEGTVTHNQFVFNPETFLAASENSADYLGIIDFGHFTTDYALFQDGVILENDVTNGSTVGVTEVYNKLRKKITKKFDELGLEYRPTDKDLDGAVRTGKVPYMREQFDVEEEVNEAAEDVARVIAKAILDAWGNETNRLQAILVTGGGSHIFKEALQKEFEFRNKQEFTLVDSAQFSNVLGFYMYGAISMTENVDQNEVFHQFVEPVFGEEQ